MVIGNTTKKIQTLVELAEELYQRVTEMREQVAALRDTVEETNRRVSELEGEIETQRALLEAVAEREGVDVEAVAAGAAGEDSGSSDGND